MKFPNIENYEKAIKHFIDKIRYYEPIILLKSLYLYRGINLIKPKSKLIHKNEEILTAMIIYVTNIYQSINLSKTELIKHINILHLEELIDIFQDIFVNSEFVVDDFNRDSKVTRLKDVSNGISYPFITLDIFCGLLKNQKELIDKVYNIGIDDMFVEFANMSMMLRGLPRTVDLNRKEDEMFSNIDCIIPDSYFDLRTQTKLPEKFLIDLSNEIGNSTDFLTRLSKPGWIYTDLPSIFHPLLRNENGIYLFHHNLFFDNLYRNIQRNIVKYDIDFKEKWNANQKVASEVLVLKMLEEFFKGSKSYLSNYYYLDSNRHENDILIIDNDLLLVVEVKAGSFSYRSSVTDSSSHDKSIKELIEKPISQVSKFLNKIQNEGSFDMFDGNNNFKYRIDKKDFQLILGVSVTIDHFNEITANYYNYDKSAKLNALPISVYDLYILLTYFESKIQFIHYLLFRMSDFVSGLMVVDELVYLEMYIVNEHFISGLKEDKELQNVGLIMTEPSVDLIDKYFNTFPKLHKRNKPIKKMHFEFKKIIDLLEKKNYGDIYKTGTTLLKIPYEFQKNIIKEAKEKSKWGMQNKKFGFAATSYQDTQIIYGYVQKSRLNKFSIDYVMNGNVRSENINESILIAVIFDQKSEKILDVQYKISKD